MRGKPFCLIFNYLLSTTSFNCGRYLLLYQTSYWCTPSCSTGQLSYYNHSLSHFWLGRRPLKLANMNRPASFPGPVKDVDSPEEGDSSTPSGEPGCKSFRPPRQTPSIGDEEQFCLEGFVLRNAMQDITQIKTKLLKLRRVIQEVRRLTLLTFS